jgi:hypothetical protein
LTVSASLTKLVGEFCFGSLDMVPNIKPRELFEMSLEPLLVFGYIGEGIMKGCGEVYLRPSVVNLPACEKFPNGLLPYR